VKQKMRSEGVDPAILEFVTSNHLLTCIPDTGTLFQSAGEADADWCQAKTGGREQWGGNNGRYGRVFILLLK